MPLGWQGGKGPQYSCLPPQSSFSVSIQSSLSSSMEATPEFTNDVSSKVDKAKKALEREMEHLDQLRKLVSNTEIEVERLKDEIASYEATLAPVASSINKCPSEILSMVFRLTISESPWHVRRLLLVCKRWYSLVVQDPQMWNNIRINVPEHEWDMEPWACSALSFISRCLERSGSAPLHVALGFANLKVIEKQLASKLELGYWKDIPTAEIDDGLLNDWLGSLDYDELIDDPIFAKRCKPDHAFDLMDKLIGPEGYNMDRWQTLEISFPTDEDLSYIIYSKLQYSAPNLTRLSLAGLDHLRGTRVAQLPDWPQIKSLAITDVEDWGMCFSVVPIPLQELFTRVSSAAGLIQGLAPFSQLRKLTINPVYWYLYHFRTEYPAETLSLPFLEELVVVGRFSGYINGIKFNLPSLKILELQWPSPISWPPQFSQPLINAIRPTRIWWDPIDESTTLEGIMTVAKDAIRVFLLHYTGSEDFCAPLFAKPILVGLLMELLNEKVLPECWKTLSFYDVSEVSDVVMVKDICP